jgi:modulator of FtsH protease HflK
MTIVPGWAALSSIIASMRHGALAADAKGPWGSSDGVGTGTGNRPSSEGETEPPAEAPSSPRPSPWATGPSRRPGTGGFGNVTSIDDLVRRGRARFGGSGGGGIGGGSQLRGRPDRSVIVWAAIALAALWLLLSTFHRIAPEQRGVVTQFGRYARTLSPGIGLTLPWPIENVRKVDVSNIRAIDLGSASEETLMLTGDQNIIDIAYSVRWTVRDPELFLFEMQNPEETIQQVAESVMRAAVSGVTLNQAIGEKRGDIEARAQEEMQRVLDGYRSGVVIQGVAIKQADPPAAVNDAFKEVSASQQAAQSDINNATSYALQLRQLSQGEATAFDKVYEQYRLSPEVTRRRMYYETMERVLQNVDKTIIEAPGVTSYLPLAKPGTPPAVVQDAPSSGAAK